ncbi:MAG: hypothetical protein LBF34_05490 [Puniceicoccales bacterium]|jgi:hypothetical protein|nr:hypothetical protein [Puniceicoccales bacterium]
MRSFILMSAIMALGCEIFSHLNGAFQGSSQLRIDDEGRMFYEYCQRLERLHQYTIIEWFDMADYEPERYNDIIAEIEQMIRTLKSIKRYRYSGCRMSLKKLRDFLKMSDIDSWIEEEVDEIAKVLCSNGSRQDWARAIQQIQENKSERNDYDHFQEFIEFTNRYHKRYPNAFAQGTPAYYFLEAVLHAPGI